MIQLRKARFEDHVAIAKLHAENWQRHYRGILGDQYLDHEVNDDRMKVWTDRLAEPDKSQEVIVATDADEVVGFACLYLDEDQTFGSYLDNLHVNGKLQGSGIGKLLLRDCAKNIIEKARDQKMYLWVYEANGDARKVYDRLQGRNFETVVKETVDNKLAPVCRYVWDNVSVLL